MAFREVSVVQIRETRRRWSKRDGERSTAEGVGVDRKTAVRYITAAIELGIRALRGVSAGHRRGNHLSQWKRIPSQRYEQMRTKTRIAGQRPSSGTKPQP